MRIVKGSKHVVTVMYEKVQQPLYLWVDRTDGCGVGKSASGFINVSARIGGIRTAFF